MNSKQKAIREAEEIHDRVIGSSSGSYRFWKTTTTTAVAKQLLMKGIFFKDGCGWLYKVKSLGCGVQEVRVIES